MRFNVYFDSFLNEKWLLSYRNNDISAAHMIGVMLPTPQRENLEKCAIWRIF